MGGAGYSGMTTTQILYGSKMTAQHLHHGDLATVNGIRVYVGSVKGYSASYHGDVDADVKRALANGHKLYWLGLQCSVICGDKGYYAADRAKWAGAVPLALGDIIRVDDSGPLTIGPAPNGNFSLTKVAK
jgi:hypothetical protein